MMFKNQKGSKKESPNRLLILAHKGVGKTTIMEGLENAVLIDLEDRSSHIDGTIANLKKESVLQGKNMLEMYKTALQELREMKQKGIKIDYLILETLSSFEPIVRKYATQKFLKTLVGRKMLQKGEIITDVAVDLPSGAGWMHFYNAYQELIGWLDGIADKAIIYTAHIRQRSIIKEDKEILGEDIDFPGKAGIDLMKNCQACGILKIDPDNDYKRVLDFSHAGTHMLTKASSSHLHNQHIEISEFKDGKLITNWDKIFI